jgi:hypothetical protein
MSSPTKRTLALLRKQGFIVEVVEKRVPGCGISRDLFGIADVLAIHPEQHIVLLVQTTTADHFANRLRRVQEQPALSLLLAAGVRVEVWAWAKRAGQWHVRREALQPGGLETIAVAQLPDGRRKKEKDKKGGPGAA